MRIISGKMGGQQLEAPRGNKTHPMSQKIRGSIFNILGDIEGLTLLDAFAGSGAVGLEAVSRGASDVIAIEINKSVWDVIQRNITKLGVGGSIKAIKAGAGGWSDLNSERLFDIVVLDPPFHQIKPLLLEKLAKHAGIAGVVVLSLPPKSDFSLQKPGYQMISSKNYGDASLAFYRRMA